MTFIVVLGVKLSGTWDFSARGKPFNQVMTVVDS